MVDEHEVMVGNMCGGCILSAPATVLDAPGVSKSPWGGPMRCDLGGGRTAGLGILQDKPTNWQNING